MSFFHNIFSKLADVAKPAADAATGEFLKHDSFFSVRTLAVVAFVGYLLYLNHLLLTPENLKLAGILVGVLIVCNTVTKLGFGLINGWVEVTKLRIVDQDGTITPAEATALGRQEKTLVE